MLFNNSMPLAHINVDFIIDGTKYEVETFKINFSQATDHKGQPQNDTKGGQFLVTLAHPADNNLLLWAKKATALKSGKVVFHTDMGMSVYTVQFENAYCVTLATHIDAQTGTKTSLVIAPEQLIVEGVEHNNRWNR